jgi:hypothetical protein
MRLTQFIIICAVAVSPGACQQLDENWAINLFQNEIDPNQTVAIQAQKHALEIIRDLADPRQNDTQKAQQAIPGIIKLLNLSGARAADGQQQASSFLFVLAKFRKTDSASVLSHCIPSLIEMIQHLPQSLSPQTHDIRVNLLNALANLQPELPVEVKQLFIRAMEGQDDSVIANIPGMASDPARQKESAARKIAAVTALATAHISYRDLISHLESVLTDKNEGVLRATLNAIGRLGSPAINLNRAQISLVAQASNKPELAKSGSGVV